MARSLAPLSVAFALLAAPAALAADQQEGPKNTITLLPVSHDLGRYGIEWERRAGPMTFHFGAGLKKPLDQNPFDPSLRQLDIELDLGLRFFAFSPAPGGFFVGPQVSVNYVHGPIRAGAPALTVTGGGRVAVNLGYTLLVSNVFVLSVALGGEYYRFYEYGGGVFARVPGKPGENLGIALRGAVGFAF
jgi:hypothetical protein